MPRLLINFFFFQDLRSSHGLNDEMKRLASSNVQQVETLLRFQLCGNVWGFFIWAELFEGQLAPTGRGGG